MQQQEIKALLSDMSLEEKNRGTVSASSYFLTATWLQALPGTGITPDDLRVSGSCLSVVGAERIHEIQRSISKNTRTISPCCSWRTS